MTQQKIDWPSVSVVEGMVSRLGYRGTGRELGVTDNSVRKHLLRRGYEIKSSNRHGTRPARSRVRTVSDEEFICVYDNSRTMGEMLKSFGYTRGKADGRASSQLRSRILEMGLIPKDGRKGVQENRRMPIELLKERANVRRRIIFDGLLPYKCDICGLDPEWQDKPLEMRLDHINGIHNDHRLKNMRFVCPNCDSQLPTFAGRNKKYK